jgi:hypothetical protein
VGVTFRFLKTPTVRLQGTRRARAELASDLLSRACVVSFKDARGIHHAAEVEAESLDEAVVLSLRRLIRMWIERMDPPGHHARRQHLKESYTSEKSGDRDARSSLESAADSVPLVLRYACSLR